MGKEIIYEGQILRINHSRKGLFVGRAYKVSGDRIPCRASFVMQYEVLDGVK